MIKIDFENKKLNHICSHIEYGVERGCGKIIEISFEDFKKCMFSESKYLVICEPCAKKGGHNDGTCTHCNKAEIYNLNVYVRNLALHDDPKAMQSHKDEWERQRQYHVLKRILKHGKNYEEVKDEPDLYEEVHLKIGKEAFSKVYKEHENGIKHMGEYLNE